MTMLASPVAICCAASATLRRPEPQTWLIPKAVRSTGMPACTAAWRGGFCPAPAVSTWPRITSSTSSGRRPARSSAALMAMAPSAWAGRLAKAPLNAPTGVRMAEAMTMSSMVAVLPQGLGLILVRPREGGKAPPSDSGVICSETERKSPGSVQPEAQKLPGNWPPSARRLCPVMKPAWAEQRKATAAAISSAVP